MQKYSKFDKPDILRHIFTQPARDDSTLPRPEGSKDVVLEAAPAIFIACRHYPAAQDSPVLLFFPSLSSSIDALDRQAEKYNAQGIAVFMFSYRGQRDNSGAPTVAAMFADSIKVFELATEWLKGRGITGPLFVMGQSLGSVCAIDTVLINSDSVKGLIIESGICETSSFLQGLGVPSELAAIPEDEGFDTIRKIERIKLPTLIFHGSRDTLVTVADAEKLQAHSGARSKQFFVIPGAGHGTLAEAGGELYFQTIKKHIDTVCGINTWRQRRKKSRNSGEQG